MTGYGGSGAPVRKRGRGGRAFTLVELMITLALLGLLGTAVGLGVGALTRQTARREAELAMHWLYGVLLRADRMGRQFSLRVQGGTALVVDWGTGGERLEASGGCSFSRLGNATGRAGDPIVYSPVWGTFTPALTLQVRGPGGDTFFLLLSGQGKLRLSGSP